MCLGDARAEFIELNGGSFSQGQAVFIYGLSSQDAVLGPGLPICVLPTPAPRPSAGSTSAPFLTAAKSQAAHWSSFPIHGSWFI